MNILREILRFEIALNGTIKPFKAMTKRKYLGTVKALRATGLPKEMWPRNNGFRLGKPLSATLVILKPELPSHTSEEIQSEDNQPKD